MKVKVGDAVLIKWQDHYSRNNGWKSLSEVAKYSKNKYFCNSVGVIVSLDKKQVVLAQNWHQPENKDWERQTADFMVIIRNCIKEVTCIKRKAL